MAWIFQAALLGVLVCGMSLCLVGCGGGGGGATKPAFDVAKTGMRAVSYAPLYLQDQSCIDTYTGKCSLGFLTDDMAAPWAKPIWGGSGRGDLATLAGLGANVVRLYGNDPRFDKKPFLDEAAHYGLQVVDGLSGYWYNENGGPQCGITGVADCHDTISEAFGKNLDNGFMDGGRYHSALTIINVMNEPDFLGDTGNFNYLKAVVSGFDGILSAEKAKGVKPWTDGTLPRITITWSFALEANGQQVCSEKYFINDPATECGPGTIFMVQFYRVVMDPVGTVGYTPKNDLKSAFHSRWINGVNLFVGADAIELQLMKPYRALSFLKDFRVFLGEWHHKPDPSITDFKTELQNLTKAPGSDAFIGVSFFQFQVAYQKNGTEREFGMLTLGKTVIGRTEYILGDSAQSHPVNCLTPSKIPYTTAAITEVWHGSGDNQGMCTSDTLVRPELVV